MSEPDKFEDDLLYALTRTGEGFRTEQADLVAGGYRRGRSRWRRRSTAAVVGGAAALALVGTGAVYLTGSTPAATSTVAAASSGTGTGSPAGTSAPAAAATPSATVITGDEVLATLQALLPKGQTTDGQGRGTDDATMKGTFAGAQLVFDDGGGKSLMSLGIQKHRKGQSQQQTCPDPKINRVDSCSVTTLADGSKLFLMQGYEYPDHRADTKDWIAVLNGPDGREINLSEWNSPQEKGAPDSRPNPPLTPDQLKAIVTDKSWDRIVAALQYDGVDRAAQDTGLSLQDRQAILAGLLPAGVTITGIDGDEVIANVRIAQGGATGLVFLRVQKLVLEPGDQTEKMFQDATVLPDGGKLMVYGPGTAHTKGQPAADVLRGDLRVYVSLDPNGKQLLTLDQLKAIATSPAWKPKK
ncbi:hypothetical protein [Streptomyces sp. FH025]|uniref:hypothetical protein n=1 Tax=Streptomyces sp. FH025 TaxID=2815937 RepID=UPI001A9EB31B|nr:hypothetical protein [Streptomyces sp. FH025]MBO1417173.1 hypothetical protein [Streptomyces sp. FH025]